MLVGIGVNLEILNLEYYLMRGKQLISTKY